MSDFLRIVDADGDHIDINHAGRRERRLLMFTIVNKGTREAAAVALDEEMVREQVAFAQAWLNAPRDAARAAAEVVIDDTADDVRLLCTTLGEWGVGQVSAEFDLLGAPIGDQVAICWCADERAARVMFAELRGKELCETCPTEVDEGELTEAGEDGPKVCPKCADELREEFKAAPYGHDQNCPGEDGCTWSGVGADIKDWDEDALCPVCNAPALELVVAPAAGATS